MTTSIQIKELDLRNIRPTSESILSDKGGTKIIIIGKPGTGKSTIIKAILHSKKHLIPVGVIISGTEDDNHFYGSDPNKPEKIPLFPELFIYNEFKLPYVESLINRQKTAKKWLNNSWAVLILDDCMQNVKVFDNPTMIGLMKNSRHWNLLTIVANQYVLDFKPTIRTSIDGVFILREPNIETRKKIYTNFAGIIPSFQLFCQLMDELTEDNTCIYIDNQTTSNDWTDCIYYYKAPYPLEDFKFGCEEFWQYSDKRSKVQS